MRCPSLRRLALIATLCAFTIPGISQPEKEGDKEKKPYRIQTAGKQVTIKSTRTIKHIMVWTASGHRIIEQRDLNQATFSFQANPREKVYFLMIQYDGMKPFTEKIGIP